VKRKLKAMKLHDSPSSVQDEMYVYVSSYDEQLAQVRKRNAPARKTSKSLANAATLAERIKAFQKKGESETPTIVDTEDNSNMSKGSVAAFIEQDFLEAKISSSVQSRHPSTLKDQFGVMKLHDSTGNVQEEKVLSSFEEQLAEVRLRNEPARRTSRSLANATSVADHKRAFQSATLEPGKPAQSHVTKESKGMSILPAGRVGHTLQGPGASLQNNATPRRLSKSLVHVPNLADRMKGFPQEQVLPFTTLAIMEGGSDFAKRSTESFGKQHKSLGKPPEDIREKYARRRVSKSLIRVTSVADRMKAFQQKELKTEDHEDSEGSMDDLDLIELLYKEMEHPAVPVAREEGTCSLGIRAPSKTSLVP
jgi:hypothetical protein